MSPTPNALIPASFIMAFVLLVAIVSCVMSVR